jgi:membrane-bound serine protease (ClpP class)
MYVLRLFSGTVCVNMGLIIPPVVLVIALAALMLLAAVALVVAMSRHKKGATGELKLVGQAAIVETTLEPEGSVLVRGELWRARATRGATLRRGHSVRVVGANGYLLEVESFE